MKKLNHRAAKVHGYSDIPKAVLAAMVYTLIDGDGDRPEDDVNKEIQELWEELWLQGHVPQAPKKPSPLKAEAEKWKTQYEELLAKVAEIRDVRESGAEVMSLAEKMTEPLPFPAE